MKGSCADEDPRLVSLQGKHADLETRIRKLKRHPGASQEEIVDLKRRKLKLKDAIEERRRQLRATQQAVAA